MWDIVINVTAIQATFRLIYAAYAIAIVFGITLRRIINRIGVVFMMGVCRWKRFIIRSLFKLFKDNIWGKLCRIRVIIRLNRLRGDYIMSIVLGRIIINLDIRLRGNVFFVEIIILFVKYLFILLLRSDWWTKLLSWWFNSLDTFDIYNYSAIFGVHLLIWNFFWRFLFLLFFMFFLFLEDTLIL